MRRPNARKVNQNQNDNSINERRMDSLKFQYRPNQPHHRSTNLLSRYRNIKQITTKSKLILFVSVVLIISILCYLVIFPANSRKVKRKFGIVIDGGSTGTRVHVFEYRVRDGSVEGYDFGEKGLASMRVNPGLSAYASDPERAGESLKELVDFGRKRVPKEYWKQTKIRLMATAGLRMLEVEVQGRILESCRKALRASGFNFQDDWASVISGSDEGKYAWVIANYALDTLGGNPLETTGIIELGGASAQVTFVSSEPLPSEYSHQVKYGNLTYNLYSHSLLQFGQNVAYDLLQKSLLTEGQEVAAESIQRGKPINPCTPKGYKYEIDSKELSPGLRTDENNHLSALLPGGNFSECRSASLMLLQKGKEKCFYNHCYIGSTFIPKLHGKFLATENFFHTSKFFDLNPQAFLSELMVAGERFCEEDWSNLKRKYSSLDEEDLLHYCFSSAYIVALLHDSLQIALDDDRIEYASQVKNIPLDWALGAFILQSVADLDSEHSSWIITRIWDYSYKWLVLCGIFLVVLFIGCSMSLWKKPHLKTIYDLEKGKYIVTRVNRI